MKTNNDFILREIAGEFILVPIGSNAAGCGGLIVLNETAAAVYKLLQTERSEEELVQEITSQYDVDPVSAQQDVKELLDQLRQIGALSEGSV